MTALAKRLGVSQQAASKSVAELIELGYLEASAGDDLAARPLGERAEGTLTWFVGGPEGSRRHAVLRGS